MSKVEGQGLTPQELADQQRQRAFSAGPKIKAGEVAQVASSTFRIVLLLGLLLTSLAVTVFVPLLGLLMLFVVVLVALARG